MNEQLRAAGILRGFVHDARNHLDGLVELVNRLVKTIVQRHDADLVLDSGTCVQHATYYVDRRC